MPVYFFDITQDGRPSIDTEGTDLPDLEAAMKEATEAMAEMAKDAIPGRFARQVTMIVRTEDNVPLLQLDLSFNARELGSQ
jgi:hypothetical protein